MSTCVVIRTQLSKKITSRRGTYVKSQQGKALKVSVPLSNLPLLSLLQEGQTLESKGQEALISCQQHNPGLYP